MSWADINRRIGDACQSADPTAALSELFDQTGDGHVAFALADRLQAAGDVRLAKAWFEIAEGAYPLPEYKRKTRQRIDSLGPTVPVASAASTATRPAPSSTSLGHFHLSREAADAVFEGPVRCPTCGTNLRVFVYRNSTAASDKVPAFYLGHGSIDGPRIGHWFVGRPDGPSLYLGEVYHCSAHVQIRVFFNRALRSAVDPLLTMAVYRK